MIHAAATAAGLAALWFMLAPSRESLLVGALALAAALLLSWRFASLDRENGLAPRVFAALPLWFSRIGVHLGNGLRVMAAAFGGGGLRPGLVRVRLSGGSDVARAAFASAASASPGMIVVEASADALLLHAADEERVDAHKLVWLEARAKAAMDGRQ